MRLRRKLLSISIIAWGILLQIFLVVAFPNTGLGRILSIPAAILISSISAISFYFVSAKCDKKNSAYLVFMFLILAVTLASVFLHPQDREGSLIDKVIMYLNNSLESRSLDAF